MGQKYPVKTEYSFKKRPLKKKIIVPLRPLFKKAGVRVSPLSEAYKWFLPKRPQNQAFIYYDS